MTVRFRLLGAIEAHRDDQPLNIGHARQQCVLVALLIDANTTVPADQLIDRVWGEHPPARARNTLHTYLTRLRRALVDVPEVVIIRRSGSYQLTVDEQAVDVHRFRQLIAQARAADDDGQALRLFEQALRLWRGVALAVLDTPWAAGLRATLDKERLAAELDHVDIALRCGLHARLLPTLSTRAGQSPLDERITGQLMVALYRAGRQADALQAFQTARRSLADELGVDPGPALQKLHEQILTADPRLTEFAHLPGPSRSPVPRQLPAAPRQFTGRANELATLSAALNANPESGATITIGGPGGAGKTWLALHWAHTNVDRFPDGHLHVNLRGFDPTGEPMSPAAAIRGFLDALGVDPIEIPLELDAQVGLYRSLVADKRMLILLDNARDTNQVLPLLPGSPTNTVLITSRNRLAGLVTTLGACPLTLDVLDDVEALELLTRHIGIGRINAEPAAVAELLRRCAGLPLALGIVAGRAATHPGLPLMALAGELQDHAGRLDALDTGETDLNLRAVFSWSYHALSSEAATLFGLLGLAPGPDIGLPAVASLAGQPATDVEMVLRQIETAYLIQQHIPGRYRMHDLVRLYAGEQANTDITAQHREAALRRLVAYYTQTAFAGNRLLDPHRAPIDIGRPVPGCHSLTLNDEPAVWAWFDIEYPNLLASHRLTVRQGWYTQVCQLAWTLDTFHHRRGHQHNWLAVWRVGLRAAQHLNDPTIQAMAHRRIGHAYSRLGRHTEAVDHLQQAVNLAKHTRDAANQGLAHHALALDWEQQGDDQRALEHANQALLLYQTVDAPVWEASELNQVGLCQARLGRYRQAQADCEAALTLARQHHYRTGEAATLGSLGYIAYQTGRHTQALHYYHHAVALYHYLGDNYEKANILDCLGQTHKALGQHDQARDVWRQALDLLHDQHRAADAERLQQRLAKLERADTQTTTRQ